MTHFFTPHSDRQSTSHTPVVTVPLQHSAINAAPLIQPKLAIGSANDAYEQEADRVAAAVVQQMNAPQPSASQGVAPQISALSPTSIQPKSETAAIAASPQLKSAIQQSGNGQALPDPIRQPMERTFRADFSSVKVHADAASDRLSRSIQARAFTTGQNIFFRQGAYSPHTQRGQTLLAHELTHVVQQTSCAQSPSSLPIQRYLEIEMEDGTEYRAADDRSIYVKQDSIYGSHELWAKTGKAAAASAILKAKKSAIELTTTATSEFDTPKGKIKMEQVEPINTKNLTSGIDSSTGMELWADCGKSARDIIGAGQGTGGGKPKAVYKTSGKPVETAGSASPTQLKEEVMLAYVLYKERKTGRRLIDKTLLASVKGKDRTTLIFQYYSGLSIGERDKIDKEVGMNRWADPNVGEGFTISTGGASKPGKKNWNFHWAGVVMKSNKGTDYVTLENYAVGDSSVENRNWDYQMYGSAKAAKADPLKRGQTFHEQHRDVHGQHGEAPTTLKVKSER
jgi:Domain of unknown function (DUF4157)